MGLLHKDRRYVKAAKIIRDYANADTHAVCWRCGRTLRDHPAGAKWQAGHTIDGSTTWHIWPHVTRTPDPTLTGPGGWLAPEASTCNASAGAAYGNRKREPDSGWLTS
jgi:hypothetical protein